MEIFWEIVKFTLPSLIVLVAVYFLINRFLNHEEFRRRMHVRKEMLNVTIPMRMTAYERLLLFVERIQPESILLRVQEPGMTCIGLQTALLTSIRQEYEHNLAQQLYVSADAFMLVKNAKESVIQLVNTAASQVQPMDEAPKLSMKIFEMYYEAQNTPSKVAIDFLKAEIKTVIG